MAIPFFKNKSGNIAITILVLGVLAICFLTLLSFYGSSKKVDTSFNKVRVIEAMNYFYDNILFYSYVTSLGKGLSPEEFFKSSVPSGILQFGHFLEPINFNLEKIGEIYILKVSYSEKSFWSIFGAKKESLYIEYPYIP